MLAELEQEKQQLITLREELKKSKPAPPISDSFSPEQKIAIFRNLFRGRIDIFANRWQKHQPLAKPTGKKWLLRCMQQRVGPGNLQQATN
jgi:hypothetical protein